MFYKLRKSSTSCFVIVKGTTGLPYDNISYIVNRVSYFVIEPVKLVAYFQMQ